MKIIKNASAGTLESSDVYVEIEPGNGGIAIDLESVVLEQFGDKIRLAVEDVLGSMGVEDALITLRDKGALECVIRARVETAVVRAGEDA